MIQQPNQPKNELLSDLQLESEKSLVSDDCDEIERADSNINKLVINNGNQTSRLHQNSVKGKSEFIRIINATKYSVEGLYAAIIYEKPFRTELIMLILMLPLVFILPILFIEKVLIIGAWLLVMAGELVNSALELLANKITTEFDLQIKKIKDYGSAVVFILIINWLLICLAILIKNL